VIGVGGGRDLLTALWGGSRVTGIEVNRILLDALRTRYREFAGIAGHPDVTLVHDEARAWLGRHGGRFDIIQMSLIDTWAATGAGAFALSENGLYTREGWRIFLDALTPTGVFSVSRWFSPDSISETTRVLSLAIASLIDRGAAAPADHVALLSRGHVATILVGRQAFSEAERATLRDVATRFGFALLVEPGGVAADAQLAAIARARSHAELERAASHPLYDFTAPTDERPFFFNMLKPTSFFDTTEVPRGGALWGNLRANSTLIVLLGIAAVLVAAIVLAPLLLAGRPDLPAGAGVPAMAYFAAIGAGFMLVQIPFLQRFSVFLGHPTYALAIVLFTMILAAGAGSAWSDRIRLGSRLMWAVPPAIAATILAEVVLLPVVTSMAASLPLLARAAIAIALIVPSAVLLGCCFPLGMRIVGAASTRATAWMWGINGATGVMASIVAVALSLWIGTSANLMLAALLYLALWGVLRALWDRTRREPTRLRADDPLA
jgi:hypothetical protein